MIKKSKSFLNRHSILLIFIVLFIVLILSVFLFINHYNDNKYVLSPFAYSDLNPGEKYTVESTITFNTADTSDTISSSETAFTPDKPSGNILIKEASWTDYVENNSIKNGTIVFNYVVKDQQGKTITTNENSINITSN